MDFLNRPCLGMIRINEWPMNSITYISCLNTNTADRCPTLFAFGGYQSNSGPRGRTETRQIQTSCLSAPNAGYGSPLYRFKYQRNGSSHGFLYVHGPGGQICASTLYHLALFAVIIYLSPLSVCMLSGPESNPVCVNVAVSKHWRIHMQRESLII